MKNNGMENLVKVVKSYNSNKKVINEVANSFLNKGFNKALAKRVFANSERLKELSNIIFQKLVLTLVYL